MTLRAILWRVAPWTVTIGAAAACLALSNAWQGPRPNDVSVPATIAGLIAIVLCAVLFCGAIAALYAVCDPPVADKGRYFGKLAAWITGGTTAVITVGGLALAVAQVGTWSLAAVLVALLSGVILATAAACTALYVGTSDKRKALKREERERLEREALG